MENNTKRSFSDKWNKNKDLAFVNTITENSEIQNWILNRNGWRNSNDLADFLKDKKKVLDAGCGNGRVTALLALNASPGTHITGIDLVAAEVAKENLNEFSTVSFFSADLLEDNSALGKFDFIYCQEVLHHTNDPFAAFSKLVKNNLERKGTIAIYVYKKKAPIREFTDDYIRKEIAELDYDAALKHCDQITELAKKLSEDKTEIELPDVKILGIEKGSYTYHRFLYHFFMKCFWNGELDFRQNSAINYDWYHPQNCTRHTMDEIKGWYSKNDLRITHAHEDFYGITMHGIKK